MNQVGYPSKNSEYKTDQYMIIDTLTTTYGPKPGAAILVPYVAVPVIQAILYTAGKQVGAGLKDIHDLKETRNE